ncbi:MAG: transcriptional regulator MraZ [Acidimicrobiaceae bacterium]
MFLGKHERSLDDKGRLVLPSTWRRAFDDAGGGILAPWDDCLGLWANDVFGDVMEKLIDKAREGVASDKVLRLFQSQAHEISLDAQGRFVIPEKHRTHAGITRDVAVIGAHNRLELWAADGFSELESDMSPADVSSQIRELRIF